MKSSIFYLSAIMPYPHVQAFSKTNLKSHTHCRAIVPTPIRDLHSGHLGFGSSGAVPIGFLDNPLLDSVPVGFGFQVEKRLTEMFKNSHLQPTAYYATFGRFKSSPFQPIS